MQAVEKWTARKGINVFAKKFIFIPINDALHWSLCVVVNPGHILSREESDPMACMLFLDSLRAHRKKKFSDKVRAWLNSEWKRINADDSDPFTSREDFPLYSPGSKSSIRADLFRFDMLDWTHNRFFAS